MEIFNFEVLIELLSCNIYRLTLTHINSCPFWNHIMSSIEYNIFQQTFTLLKLRLTYPTCPKGVHFTAHSITVEDAKSTGTEVRVWFPANLNFLRLSFRNCITCIFNYCDEILHIYHKVQIYEIHIFIISQPISLTFFHHFMIWAMHHFL